MSLLDDILENVEDVNKAVDDTDLPADETEKRMFVYGDQFKEKYGNQKPKQD